MRLAKGSFFGEIKKSAESNNYLLTESSHSPNSTIPYHFHENPYFSLVLRGDIIENNRSNGYLRKPGTLVYHPANYGHSNLFKNEDSEIFNIQLMGQLLNDLNGLHFKNSCQFILDESIVRSARRIYVMFIKKSSIKAILNEIYRLLENLNKDKNLKLSRTLPDWFCELIEYIETHYNESITLDKLSDQVSIHPVHISRSFSRYLRCTMINYLHKVRIEKACLHLRSDPVSLSPLAYKLGYTDHSHFTRTFTTFVGIAPAQYRDLFCG